MKHRKLFPFLTDINQTQCPDFCDQTCPYGCFPYPTFYFIPPPPPPPPPPPLPPISTDEIQLVSPYVIVIVSVLAIFFILVSYYLIIVKYCTGWNRVRPPPPTLSDGQDEEFLEENRGPPPIDHHVWHISTIGLQPSIINSITIFKYKKVDRLIEGTECSVCLNEFQEGETLRLLPKCNHGFHIPCIDTWLRSHTNCPLCRAGIVSHITSTSSASNGQSSLNLNSEEGTQMENLESGGELANNWASDCEVCENRAETEDEVELQHMVDERKLNPNEIGVLEDNDMIMEDEIQPVRRSVSMDSSSDATISLNMANHCVVESEGNSIDQREDAQKSDLGIVEKQDCTNSRSSSSIAQYLHKCPVAMKRSFSCGGRLFLSRLSRNSSSILPL
ncbi:unnamed protein product [Camellia sinensis]